MPTSASLERLETLLKRLGPLAQAARGELIRADDWNALVNSVMDLARAILAEEQSGDVPPHTHTDEVSMSWLDKALRTLISGGPLTDPLQDKRLIQLERRVQTVSEDVANRKSDVIDVRNELSRITTKDLARENTVVTLDRKVEGLRDGREEIGGLRKTLDTIQSDIRTVQTITGRFQGDDGQIIDIRGLSGRVKELEGLRGQLTDANGEILSAVKLDQKLAELSNTLVTEDELKTTLDERLGNIDSQISDTLEGRISANIDERVSSTLNGFRAEVDASVAKGFEGMDSRIASAVADEMPGIREQVVAAVQTQFQGKLDALKEELTAVISARTDAVRQDMLKTNEALKGGFTAMLDERIEMLQKERSEAISKAMDTVRKEFDAKLDKRDAIVAGSLRTEMASYVNDRLEIYSKSNDVKIASNLNEFRTSIESSMDNRFRGLGLTDRLIGIDDFTALEGIGEVYHNRLQAANIRTYKDLAQLNASQIVEIAKMPLRQVEVHDIVGQAKRLAQQ